MLTTCVNHSLLRPLPRPRQRASNRSR